MSDDKQRVSLPREALDELKSLLRGADPDAPLVDRLRKPRTPYSPALLREEAADRIEALTAERDALKAEQIDAIRAALEAAHDAIADYPRIAPEEAEWTRYDEQIEHSQHIIRAIDPAAIAAKLKGDDNERA